MFDLCVCLKMGNEGQELMSSTSPPQNSLTFPYGQETNSIISI